MKILVPTDYSDNADNAVDYAAEMAQRLGADEIMLISTLSTPYSAAAGSLVNIKEKMREEADETIAEAAARLNTRLAGKLRVTSKVVEGDPVPVVNRVAEHDGYQLIVMGNRGSSDLKEAFTGSVANGLIKQTKTPVLAVPSDVAVTQIDRIVLAADDKPVDPVKMGALTTIARAYNAEILVYHQGGDKDDHGIHATLRDALKDTNHSLHANFDTGNVKEGIDNFLTTHNAQLLCMIRRERNFFADLFNRSTVSRELFDSRVPLLVLPE